MSEVASEVIGAELVFGVASEGLEIFGPFGERGPIFGGEVCVAFDLGDGRTVRGTVSGEIALYFCRPDGKVFDIVPDRTVAAASD